MVSKKVYAIEQAFCKLLQENELKKITVSRICSNAGVSRATFYTYFDNTEALLQEIEERTLADISQIYENWSYFSIKSLGEVKIAPVNMEISRYCHKHREVFRALFGPYGDEAFICRYENYVYQDYLKHIRAEANLRVPELLASACAGAMIGLCRVWFSDNTNLATVEEMALLRTAVTYRLFFSADQFSDVFQAPSKSSHIFGQERTAPVSTPQDENLWSWNSRGEHNE